MEVTGAQFISSSKLKLDSLISIGISYLLRSFCFTSLIYLLLVLVFLGLGLLGMD